MVGSPFWMPPEMIKRHPHGLYEGKKRRTKEGKEKDTKREKRRRNNKRKANQKSEEKKKRYKERKRRRNDKRERKTKVMVGSPFWMPPEMIKRHPHGLYEREKERGKEKMNERKEKIDERKRHPHGLYERKNEIKKKMK